MRRRTVVVRAVLAAAVAVAVVALVDVGGVIAAAARAEWRWLAVVAAAIAVSAVAKVVTWHGCLRGLPGVGPAVRRTDLVGPFFVGALVNTGVPARAGDAMRVAMARQIVRHRGGEAGLAEVAGTVVAEHLVSTAVWGVLVVLVAPMLPLPWGVRAGAVGLGAGAVAVIVLAGRVRSVEGRGGRVVRRVRGALTDGARAVHHAARVMRRPRAFAEVTGSAAVHWAGQWAAVWAVLAALGMTGLGPMVAASVVVALALAHAVPVTPGGIGAAQAGVALPLVAAGAAAPEALAAGVVLQGVEIVLNAVAGAVFLLSRRDGRTPGRQPGAAATRR